MIPLTRSTFYREAETKERLWTFLREAQQLSFGAECQRFESAFARVQGRAHCVLVNSGSSANLALIQALLNLGRLRRGDAVGFSALTWATNVMPLIQLGLTAVPVDVELDTLNVSSRTLVQTLARLPLRALFLTDLLGFCDDPEVIRDRCRQEDILLLEDACEALGSVYRGTRLGNFGFASTFSFYVGHHLSTIEGGAICTDDEGLATMLRIVRAHGWDRNLTADQQGAIRRRFRLNTEFESRYTFYDLGYNLRPTEICGFLGNAQLPHLDEIVARRQENFLRLAPALYARADTYYPLRYDHIEVLSNFAVPLVCRTREQRDALVASCARRIELRPIVGGDITKQPFFRKHQPALAETLGVSNASLVNDQGLYFGNNPELTADDLRTLLATFAPGSAVPVGGTETAVARTRP